MRLVIDMQGAQSTGSRNRGIGRYSLSLAMEMARQRGNHEVILALNGLFPETITPLRRAFAGVLPPENITVWDAIGPVHAADPANDARRQIAEMTREATLARLKPDFVLNTSLLEGFVDNAATSIGRFDQHIPTATILYDLIPLIHSSIYLKDSGIERWYMQKIAELRRSDILLSISASAGQEAISHLQMRSGEVVNISTACDGQFCPMPLDETARTDLLSRYGIHKPFIMYTGGIDHRKNIEGLIRAYALLPKALRSDHQLGIVCSIHAHDRERLQKLAKSAGLSSGEVIFTGFVPEADLVGLYNECKLFVFPSWHEGFGLPALEAMSCGRAVIGANTSSIPEVIGREDALFDPFDDQSISDKMAEALANDQFRLQLQEHGLRQARSFSWKSTASRAWRALEAQFDSRKRASIQPPSRPTRRPRMAFVSPLPPEQSGISDYAAELLPELARHYDIDVIATTHESSDPWTKANCATRSIDWFRANAHRYDRVMYQFGNSHFHGHMPALLEEIPGVVVLHDFFLSGMIGYIDAHGQRPHALAVELLKSHGWKAVSDRYRLPHHVVVTQYPANLSILQSALGMIVHSEHSRQLATSWYGAGSADDWSVIPLLRTPARDDGRQAARKVLGINNGDLLVCSFGHLAPTKLNDRLLRAWCASPLAQDPHCHLVFVGQNPDDKYGTEMTRQVRSARTAGRVEITGWTSADTYRRWLEAADIGVQLRTNSRGETSAAVLDCMNHGLATIANANGSMASLPAEGVLLLPDEFTDDQLISALARLWKDKQYRQSLATQGRQAIHLHHHPRACAEQYVDTIERCYAAAESAAVPSLTRAISQVEPGIGNGELQALARALASNFPPLPRRRQLLLDVSAAAHKPELLTAEARILLSRILLDFGQDYDIVPVCTSNGAEAFVTAFAFASQHLGIPGDWAADRPAEAWSGDLFLALGANPFPLLPHQQHRLASWRERGIGIFMMTAGLPVPAPCGTVPEALVVYARFLDFSRLFDGAICLSRTEAELLLDMLHQFGDPWSPPLGIAYINAGADWPAQMEVERGADTSLPTGDTPMILSYVAESGTSAALQLAAALTLLREKGHDYRLVLAGHDGPLPGSLRAALADHAALGKHLFLVDTPVIDGEALLGAATALVALDEQDSTGMALLRAARMGIPILARDTRTYRELAGDHVVYLAETTDAALLADQIAEWATRHLEDRLPNSGNIAWSTWTQALSQLREHMLHFQPCRTWTSDGVLRLPASDPRIFSQVGTRSVDRIETSGESGILLFGPYMPLAAGTYRIHLHGTIDVLTGNEWFDISSGGGSVTSLRLSPIASESGTWLVDAEFSLQEAATDIEFRIWVEEQTRLSFVGIEISRTDTPAGRH